MGEIGSCNLLCFGVVSVGLLQINLLGLAVFGILAKISIEVSLHFFEENDGLRSLDVMFVLDDLFFE